MNGYKNQRTVYEWVNILINQVYEWVYFFNDQVYDWGRFQKESVTFLGVLCLVFKEP